MDWYLVSVVVFIAILVALVYKDRKKIRRESILLLRKTQMGKNFLINLGRRFPRFWVVVGFIAVIVGFGISIWMTVVLIQITIQSVLAPTGLPTVGVLVPSLSSSAELGPGYFAIPFWYWIAAIASLIVVHEGMHGIFAARERIRIKSLGVGLLLVIPLAFVEIDEKQTKKKKNWQQLRVFAAGSFGNFLLAGATGIMLILITMSLFVPAGVAYQGLIKDYPAAGVNMTGVIVDINGYEIKNQQDLSNVLEQIGSDKMITVTTSIGTETKKFILTTAGEPEPVFVPNPSTHILANMEMTLPGTIEFTHDVSAIFGQQKRDWTMIRMDIKFWEYLEENYPSLSEKARNEIKTLELESQDHPRSGFIGVAGVADYGKVIAGFEAYEGMIQFIGGLLFYVFLINFLVGAFNLLPIGPLLDGGRMWEILLMKIVPKHAKRIVKGLSYFILLLIIINFAVVFAGFL